MSLGISPSCPHGSRLCWDSDLQLDATMRHFLIHSTKSESLQCLLLPGPFAFTLSSSLMVTVLKKSFSNILAML